jgi:hypothetical protein
MAATCTIEDHGYLVEGLSPQSHKHPDVQQGPNVPGEVRMRGAQLALEFSANKNKDLSGEAKYPSG